MTLHRPWQSVLFVVSASSIPSMIGLVATITAFPSSGWLIPFAFTIIWGVPAAHFSLGRASIEGATYTFSGPFWSWKFQFIEGDELWGGTMPLSRSTPYFGAMGCYRDPQQLYRPWVRFLRGASFMPSARRELWASVIVAECRRVGLELQYRRDMVEKT